MSSKSNLLQNAVGRKLAMALSALFLIIFLILHVTVNFISTVNVEMFNTASHFMGTNPLIQFLMQPILAFAVVFHFVMGFILERKNRMARPVAYNYTKPGESSSWLSRNMIISGITILLFLALHFYDFWFHELKVKYIEGVWNIEDRYWEELHHAFSDPIRVLLYCIAFVFLCLHLMHGFQSSFQSVGLKNKDYTPIFEKLSNIYAVVVCAGFIYIAVFHYLNQ